MDTTSAYYFFIGWFLILGSLWLMAKAEGTRTLVYYILVLAIVLDLVTHYAEINGILTSAGFLKADVLTGGGATGPGQIGSTPIPVSPGHLGST